MARSTVESSLGRVEGGYYNPSIGIAYIPYNGVVELNSNYELLTQGELPKHFYLKLSM